MDDATPSTLHPHRPPGNATAAAAARWTAGMFLALFLVFLAPRLPLGTLTNTDELLSAERSREMLLHGPGAVHFNHQPDFHKPPLQYWLTALALVHPDHDPELAVRLPSLLYGALAAAATWLLARAVDPGRPWTAALAVALLTTSPLVVSQAKWGLLDTGLAFFTTAALAAAMLARERPRWWFAVAAACVLASLQKGPLALALVGILVAARVLLTSPPRERRNYRWRGGASRHGGRWLAGGALGLAAVGLAGWPLLQILAHGMPAASAFGFAEVAALTGDSRLGARPPFYALHRLTTNWVWGGPALLAAAGFLLAPGRERRAPGLAELGALCLAGIALALALGFRSVRYLLPLVPALCVLTAAGAHRIGEWRRLPAWGRGIALGAGVALFAVGAEQAHRRAFAAPSDAPEQRALAREIGVAARAGDSPLLLVRGEDDDAPGGVLFPSFYLFYGALPGPVRETTRAQLARVPAAFSGVCRREDFPAVQARFPSATIRSAHGDFLWWSSPSPDR